ncbi:MAG: IclR family transcriptional regulator [Dehalococcoidales bacterium]|nr:IclR family transcriptional regulator [Dehalococcoidales bacterium]
MRNKKADPGTKPPAVKSISRAGSVLRCLGSGYGTITEIANRCNLSKSTVHRLLKALEETLLVSRNPINHRYYLGPLIAQFSSNPENTHDYLITSALDEMKHLSEKYGETMTLGLLSGIQYIHLHEVQSPSNLKVIESGPPVRPLFMGATTRVLMAQLPPAELRIVLNNTTFREVTPNTLTDKKDLKSRLEIVKSQGYETSYGETVPGALCIAAPINSYVLPAVISVVGPENRLEPRREDATRELLVSAERITRDITEIFGPKEAPA